MAFWNKRETRADEGVTADVLFAQMFSEKITAADAMNIPAVARCVNMIAAAVASLPVKLYERTEDGVNEVEDDNRLELLNNRTGDTVNASEMRIKWVMDYLLLGNAYAYIDRDIYSRIKRIVYISPAATSVKANRSDPINKIYSYNVNGRELLPYQMLKLLRHTDGYGKGSGIVAENALMLSVAYQTLKFEKNLVKKGGNKKGFLKAQKTLSKDAMAALKANWNKLYSSDGDNCLILNDGMDFKEASNTSVEMQLNENKKLNGNDIMTLFGTADGMLSDATVKNAIMPVLDAFEAAFDADLLDEDEKKTKYFAFDTRELTRGDIQQRYNAYAVALQNNFMQLDEVRAEEDLPPLGVNFIKLGLNDVLLNPDTNMVYTPNTNAWADMGAKQLTGRTEERAVRGNPFHDSLTGQFTSGNAFGYSAGFRDDMPTDRKMNIAEITKVYSNGGVNNSSKSIDKSVNSGIIEHKDEIIKELKENGFPYEAKIPPKEIDVDSLTFNSNHANVERNHNVSEEEAKSYVKKADFSYTVFVKDENGEKAEFENYFSENGASYVDISKNNIRTAFKRSDFIPKVEDNTKIIDKYRK